MMDPVNNHMTLELLRPFPGGKIKGQNILVNSGTRQNDSWAWTLTISHTDSLVGSHVPDFDFRAFPVNRLHPDKYKDSKNYKFALYPSKKIWILIICY